MKTNKNKHQHGWHVAGKAEMAVQHEKRSRRKDTCYENSNVQTSTPGIICVVYVSVCMHAHARVRESVSVHALCNFVETELPFAHTPDFSLCVKDRLHIVIALTTQSLP